MVGIDLSKVFFVDSPINLVFVCSVKSLCVVSITLLCMEISLVVSDLYTAKMKIAPRTDAIIKYIVFII